MLFSLFFVGVPSQIIPSSLWAHTLYIRLTHTHFSSSRICASFSSRKYINLCIFLKKNTHEFCIFHRYILTHMDFRILRCSSSIFGLLEIIFNWSGDHSGILLLILFTCWWFLSRLSLFSNFQPLFCYLFTVFRK